MESFNMITAQQAHKLSRENRTMHIVARQLVFVYNWIEGRAILGETKCNWIAPEEFTKDEIKHIVENVRERGFEIERHRDIYTFYW